MLLQNTENRYCKMWRNMVPLAKYGSLLYICVYLCKGEVLKMKIMKF